MFTLFLTHFLLYLLSLISGSKAVLVNVTVDDSKLDLLSGQTINFQPSEAWNIGQGCGICNADVDAGHMLNESWHDGTYSPDNSNGPLYATFKFNGTAIYIYCAVALENNPTFTSYSNMTFYIDNQIVGKFEQPPPGKDGFNYNVSVYSHTSLSPGQHQFVLQNGGGRNASLTLFDYLVYSYDNGLSDPTSTPSASSGSSKIPAIVGSVVGGVSGAITVIIIWFLIRRWQSGKIQRMRKGSNFSMDGFHDDHIIPDPFLPQNFSSQPLMGGSSNHGAPGPHEELDAGPVTGYRDESEEGAAVLPPQYNSVFASTSSRMTGTSNLSPPNITRSGKS